MKRILQHTIPLNLLLVVLVCSLYPLNIASADPVISLEKIRVQLKWVHQFQFAGFYAAIEKGYYRAEGLDVTLLEGYPGVIPAATLDLGAVQFAVDNPSAMVQRQQGHPIVFIAVIFQHSPTILLTRSGSGIDTPHDLRGKKIMASPATDPEFFAMLANEGMKPESLVVVPHTFMLDDLIAGRVDAQTAYLTNEPRQMIKRGIKSGILRPSHYSIDFYGDCLVTSEKIALERPELVERFLRATRQGWNYAMQHPREIAVLIQTRYNSKKPLDDLLYEAVSMRELIHPELVEIGHMNPERWRQIAATFEKFGMLKPGFSVDSMLYDNVRAKAVASERHLLTTSAAVVGTLMLLGCMYGVVLFLFNKRLAAQVEQRTLDLKESEANFRTIFDSVSECIFIHDPKDGRILDVNARTCEAFGYSSEDFHGLSVGNISSGIPPYTQEEASKRIQQTVQGQMLTFEWQCKAKDGRLFWVEVSTSKATLGTDERVLVSLQDISQRKRAEETLLASERRFSELIRNSSDSITILDKDGVQVFVSDAVERILGYNPSELLGIPVIEEMLHPDDQAKVRAAFAAIINEGKGGVEYRHKHKNGSWVYLEAWGTNQLENTDIAGVVVNVRDITERKRVEEALAQSEERFRCIVETANEGVWTFGVDDRTIYLNRTMAQMLGFEPEEILGRYMSEFLFPEDVAVHKASLQDRHLGLPSRHERRLRNKVGGEVWTLVSASPVMGTDGSYNGRFGMFSDITERKRIERILEVRESLVDVGNTTGQDGILVTALDKAETITQSAISFFHLMEADDTTFVTQAWSTRTRDCCVLPDKLMRCDAFCTKFCVGAIRTGRAVIQNNYPRSSDLHALPEGHVPVDRVLVVPIFDQDKLVGLIGVGNKPSDYDERDIDTLTRLGGLAWGMVTRKRAQNELQNSNERFHTLFDNMMEGVALHSVVHDGQGQPVNYVIEAVNKSYERILNLRAEDVEGKRSTDVYGTTEPPFREQFLEVARTGRPEYIETYFAPMGKHFSISIAPWINGGFSTIFSDITERKQLEEQLLYRALHDPLTGLANRTLCLDRIAQANERAARRPENTFAVVFIDLDGFKAINDSLGHEAGDLVLSEVAKRLLACARRVDTVCRYGGDEFILVLEEVNPRETVRTVKRVQESLEHPLTVGTQKLLVQASYGIAYAPQENCQPEDLLRNANIALHRAKLSGKDKIVAYRRGMHEAAIHTMSLQSDMRRGLDADEFFMVYQPIFNLADNRLVGFEALIRWRHPQRGLVGPGEFIPIAEDSGFIYELGHFALNHACKDMVEQLSVLSQEDHLTISVNLSPRQLSRQGLAEQIEQTLTSTGLPPSSLVLEVTESSIMKYPEASAHILARLKEKGVEIAIDDFGTGYSSMSVLQKLPLDRLKVDMSFVARMTHSREDREIVRAIITLSHSLNLKTVAEGIETEEQRLSLRHMGCDMGQGYLCSRPMLLADVPDAIRKKFCAQGE